MANRLATIDMGLKVGVQGLETVVPFSGELGPHLTQCLTMFYKRSPKKQNLKLQFPIIIIIIITIIIIIKHL